MTTYGYALITTHFTVLLLVVIIMIEKLRKVYAIEEYSNKSGLKVWVIVHGRYVV